MIRFFFSLSNHQITGLFWVKIPVFGCPATVLLKVYSRPQRSLTQLSLKYSRAGVALKQEMTLASVIHWLPSGYPEVIQRLSRSYSPDFFPSNRHKKQIYTTHMASTYTKTFDTTSVREILFVAYPQHYFEIELRVPATRLFNI